MCGFRHCDCHPELCSRSLLYASTTVEFADAPCWLLYHDPIVAINSFHALCFDRPGESSEAMDGKKRNCTSLPVSFNVSVCGHFMLGMQKLSPSFLVVSRKICG